MLTYEELRYGSWLMPSNLRLQNSNTCREKRFLLINRKSVPFLSAISGMLLG